MFFAFDGIDGAGKSTQLRLLDEWLRAQGHVVVTCRDPGSTALGEKLREIVLNADHSVAIARRSEMLLYMAARAQLVEEVIRPTLDAGHIVVSDRYLLANLCYQAYAGGLPVDDVRMVGQIATDGVLPDCIFLLDIDEEISVDRLSRPLDRMERQEEAFRRRLRQGFLTEAAADRDRIHVIQAARSIEEVHGEVRRLAQLAIDRESSNSDRSG